MSPERTAHHEAGHEPAADAFAIAAGAHRRAAGAVASAREMVARGRTAREESEKIRHAARRAVDTSPNGREQMPDRLVWDGVPHGR